MKTTTTLSLASAAILITLVTGCGSTNDNFNQVVASEPAPIPITQSTTIGAPHFPDGDTTTGGSGQDIDGIQANSTENLVYHIHAHLSLFVSGKQIAIPKGIGIVPPRDVQQGFVDAGSAFYWMHTHDATGIIHIESPENRAFTLGDFFDIWGEPLSRTHVADFTGEVRVSVDGTVFTGDPRNIPLNAHTQITIEVGTPLVAPPLYVFPDGL